MASFVFNPRSDSGGSSGGGASAELVELVELVEEIERIDVVNNSQNTLISSLVAVNTSQDGDITSLNTRMTLMASVNGVQNSAISALDSGLVAVKAYTNGLQPKITTTATVLALEADTINIATVGSSIINIGTGSNPTPTIINVGGVGDTVNVAGNLVVFETTNTAIKDKIVSLNRGGGVSSGFNSGVEIEEDGVGTGYIKTNADRSKFIVKAPAGAEFELAGSVVGNVSATANTLVQRDAGGEGRFTSVIAEGSNGVVTRQISNISGEGIPLDIIGYDVTGRTIAKLTSSSSSEGGLFLQRIDGANLIKCCDLKLYGGSSGNTTDAQAIFRAEARGVPNKFSNTNATEAQVFTNDVRRAYFGATFSGVESPFFTAPNLIATTTLAVNNIDMTPTTATTTGNWFRVRTTGNFTISFRRYGDLVFWSIPPIMDVITPINTIYNATTTFDYFEFTGLIPVGFRPLASSNRSLSAITVWNGNAVANAYNLAYVNMISNGLIVVNLPNGQNFQNGRLAGWHTTLQGSYRIV